MHSWTSRHICLILKTTLNNLIQDMPHRYLPHTDDDIARMLADCGLTSLDDLFSDIPDSLRLRRRYNIPEEKSEKEVRDFFRVLSDSNSRLTCFAGNGFYDRTVPAAAASLTARSEFLTAYTPYQPEISQGTLQYIFEYQTLMARLTGLDISNASMYDGATATAEAMIMAVANARKRNRVLISATVNKAVAEVAATYARYHGVKLDMIEETDGVTSADDLRKKLAEGDVAGVILPIPNRYGIVEDFTGWADLCHQAKALMIMNCVAADLVTLRSPGEWGADIAVGDAQSLGLPLSFGGPYLGFMTATKALMRKMPGRIVGATTDADGQRVFVLTLQAREQHIRREKATSNICSNQGLMALYVTICMSLMGSSGYDEANRRAVAGAHYLADELTKTGKMRMAFPGRPFFNEFAIRTSIDIDMLMQRLADNGILGGVRIGTDMLLVAVTETQSRADIEKYIDIVKQF